MISGLLVIKGYWSLWPVPSRHRSAAPKLAKAQPAAVPRLKKMLILLWPYDSLGFRTEGWGFRGLGFIVQYQYFSLRVPKVSRARADF